MNPETPIDLEALAARARLRRFSFAVLAASALVLLAVAWPLLKEAERPQQVNAAVLEPAPIQQVEAPAPVEPPPAAALPNPLAELFAGSILLSLPEGGHQQLYWHRLDDVAARLTQGAWDDVQPAASPQGERLAFASNRGGHWDLYILDLANGETMQLSDDAAYDGRPSWSPNGDWLAYERYAGEHLEIFMRPLDGSVEPVPLSNSPAADYAPAWRPGAQQIAFVSTRSSHPQIWLLDLEVAGERRFRPVAADAAAQDAPAWSPDGRWLAWAQQEERGWAIYITDMDAAEVPRRLGPGRSPQWNPTGSAVLAELRDAQHSYLTAYDPEGGLALPPQALPGPLEGMAWAGHTLGPQLPPTLKAISESEAAPGDKTPGTQLAGLDGVHAPNPQLSQAALPAFEALRARAAQLLGWDALSSLDSAALALADLLPPGRQHDWLYTGRAFELHASLLPAGWMAVVREDYAGETYWRVYLRTAEQAGGLGEPMTQAPWNFAAGKAEAGPPAGYWVDFTALAAAYGFERPAALGNWRSYYPGMLFTQFVYRQGLEWDAAMLQLYSADELAGMLAAGSP